ncbi:hypothetical protein PIB30_060619 [Stylosanthes scabra]|uniref:PB1-like domain-containing protein n=1 Tax=Stylosanthes scabra TaxID=79078 RepID=A0ABU6WIX6_9FABA|nr:hypothetical protein [Stylosanthes scabra]
MGLAWHNGARLDLSERVEEASSRNDQWRRSFESAIGVVVRVRSEQSLPSKKMDEVIVVPVFHVGGWMVRNEDGALVYDGGTVEKLERIDIEVLSFGDLVNMLGGLGYKTHRVMHWYDFAEDVFELGLCKILGDAEVFDLRSHVVRNFGLVDEFHIYVEHEVNVPLLATAPGDTDAEPTDVDEEGDASSSSSDDGGYETTEDEPISLQQLVVMMILKVKMEEAHKLRVERRVRVQSQQLVRRVRVQSP